MIARHVEDLLDGYLLGALQWRERAEAQTHLSSCVPCNTTLGQRRALIGVLPAQLDDLSPRPALRAKLLAAARADLAQQPWSRPSRLLPFRMDSRSSNPVLRWASLGMAAAFVVGLVGGLAGWALVLGDRLEKKSDDLAKSDDTITTLVENEPLLRMESTLDGARVTAVLSEPRTGTGALLVVTGLPQATTGSGYQLWLLAGSAQPPVSTALMPDARGMVIQPIAADLQSYEGVEIDLEPSGATQPGGRRMLAGALR